MRGAIAVHAACAVAVAVAIAVAACSDDDARTTAATPSTATDAGAGAPEAAVEAAAPSTAMHRGTVIDYNSKQPIAGATVKLRDGSEGATDANGFFAISVPTNTPYTATITAPDHVVASFGEIELSADHDQGTFILSSLSHSVQAREFMADYDPTKAVLLVSIAALPGCSGIAGSTLAVEPAGAAKVRYFFNGLQSFEAAVKEGEEPAGVMWNVEPNVPVKVKVTSPSCTQAAGRVAAGSATYSETITAKRGGDLSGQLYLSYVRVHLK